MQYNPNYAGNVSHALRIVAMTAFQQLSSVTHRVSVPQVIELEPCNLVISMSFL
jgi:hypothetical protein